MARTHRIAAFAAAGILAALAAGVPASGQALGLDDGSQPQDVSIRPPKADAPGTGRTWLYAIIAVVGMGAAVGIGILPSKRTHQD